MIDALRRWQRRRELRRHAVPDAVWRQAVGEDVLFRGLSREESDRLRELATLFLARKTFFGAADAEVGEIQAVRIAALAAIPILGLGIDWYRGWHSVIVYPSGFLARHHAVDETGVVHEQATELIGEAMEGGAVVLSWEDVEAGHERDGWNVVIHELSHKLDMLNGEANGMPPLHADMHRQAWTAAFTAAYDALGAALERGGHTPIDPYAATDPAECFAVMSETFFETPEILNRAFPEVYRQLTAFYRQDPAARGA
ncbi:zinc-dependent peptidase [Arhodomonas sp. AD133]|uniref:M90 family metallopeptidase n=1 Tax=Arhodomonas sp. AD133 TaxID=3415009 RepID=UPI003EB7BAE8